MIQLEMRCCIMQKERNFLKVAIVIAEILFTLLCMSCMKQFAKIALWPLQFPFVALWPKQLKRLILKSLFLFKLEPHLMNMVLPGYLDAFNGSISYFCGYLLIKELPFTPWFILMPSWPHYIPISLQLSPRIVVIGTIDWLFLCYLTFEVSKMCQLGLGNWLIFAIGSLVIFYVRNLIHDLFSLEIMHYLVAIGRDLMISFTLYYLIGALIPLLFWSHFSFIWTSFQGRYNFLLSFLSLPMWSNVLNEICMSTWLSLTFINPFHSFTFVFIKLFFYFILWGMCTPLGL